MIRVRPTAVSLANSDRAALRDAQPGADQQQERDDDHRRAEEAHLLADDREDEVALGDRDQIGPGPETEPRSADPAAPERVPRLDELGARARCVLPGIEPVLDPDVDLREVAARHVRADPEEDHPEEEIAGPSRGHPQEPDEEGEEHGREADVVLEAHHRDRRIPRRARSEPEDAGRGPDGCRDGRSGWSAARASRRSRRRRRCRAPPSPARPAGRRRTRCGPRALHRQGSGRSGGRGAAAGAPPPPPRAGSGSGRGHATGGRRRG